MRHSKALSYVHAFDRSELSPVVRESLDFHLAECASCAAEAEKTAAFEPFLSQMASEATVPGLDQALEAVRQRTLRIVRQEAKAPSASFLGWLHGLPRLSFAVPAAVAAVVLAVVLMPRLETWTSRPAPQARVQPTVMSASSSHDFIVARQGTEVQIAWAKNGRKHYVRRATDPVSVKVAGRQVAGSVWKENEGNEIPAPGTVTYYLVD